VQAAIEALTDRFAARFPVRIASPRRIGREAEFPLVRADGRAGDTFALWDPLRADRTARVTYDDPDRQTLIERIELDDAAYEVEMGRATVEVVLPPVADLIALEVGSAGAVRRVVRAAASEGMAVLGYGIQPRTPGTPALMTAKRRYLALHRAIGRPWLRFTTTASDQVQIDVTRGELLDAINLMNLLSGPVIALTANSRVYGGRIGAYRSGREALLAALGRQRHGMTPRRFESLEEFVGFICAQTCYVLPEGKRYRSFRRPFTAYLAERGPDLTAYLWHEHYTWNSARPRAHHGTIEIRPACQQPPDESLAAAALSLGLVEALPHLGPFLQEELGPDPWPAMAAYRRAAVRDGVRARQPAPRLLAGLLDLAASALRRRGRGEERYLRPLFRRLERRELPADRAAARFRRGRVGALIQEFRL
jgi:gamma-glutamylcysteine synthetase